MIGNISTQEANTLLRRASAASTYLLSQRTALESKLFPVTAYNSVACAQIYRDYQYNMFKELANHISPEEIGKRCRTLAAYPNILGVWAFIGLWGLGRMQDLFDAGGAQNELPERRKQATTIVIDPLPRKIMTPHVYSRRMSLRLSNKNCNQLILINE